MRGFLFAKRKHHFRSLILSVFLLVAVIFLLYTGVNTLSRTSLEQQKITLLSALNEGALHCYALYGYYPEDLDALLSKYHIIYDEDMFFVDYQPNAQNLMPEITVISKSNEGGDKS